MGTYKQANDSSVHPSFLEANQASLPIVDSNWPQPIELVFKPSPHQSGGLQWETSLFDLMSEFSSQHVVLFWPRFFSKTFYGSLLLRGKMISVAKDLLSSRYLECHLSFTYSFNSDSKAISPNPTPSPPLRFRDEHTMFRILS